MPLTPSAPLRSPPMRVMSGRTVDSTRITSAPNVASQEVAWGTASTQPMSVMRTP